MILFFDCPFTCIYLSEDKTEANPTSSLPGTGKTATVKIVDVASEQLIAGIEVRG